MEFQKITNFLDTTSDDKDLPTFVTKKWIEVYDQSKKNYSVNKEIRIKMLMLRSNLCSFSDVYIVVKGNITVTDPNNAKTNKNVAFKIMHYLSTAFQKLMVNTVKITEKQQEVCRIITEMNQVILFLLILSHLNKRQVLQEILVMLVLVKMVIMQTKLVKMKLKLLFH